MAYRQLCSVSFAVFGLVALGCGGSTASSTGTGAPTATDQPPTNADAPTSSNDQAPGSADSPPSNPDSPPGTADAPAGSGAGGRLGSLCRQVCSSLASAVDQCSQGASMVKVKTDCGSASACQVPADFAPCANEIGAVLECFINNIAAFCPTGGQNADQGQGQGQGQGQDAAGSALDSCTASLTTATACATAHHIDLTSNMMDMTTDPMNPPGNCMTGNDCTKCLCNAAGDTAKTDACVTGACATPTP